MASSLMNACRQYLVCCRQAGRPLLAACSPLHLASLANCTPLWARALRDMVAYVQQPQPHLISTAMQTIRRAQLVRSKQRHSRKCERPESTMASTSQASQGLLTKVLRGVYAVHERPQYHLHLAADRVAMILLQLMLRGLQDRSFLSNRTLLWQVQHWTALAQLRLHHLLPMLAVDMAPANCSPHASGNILLGCEPSAVMHVAFCAWSDAAACLAEHGKLSPIPILLQGTALQRVTDVALGVAIPVHSHIAINSVLSDYVPKSVMGEGLPE